MKVDEIRLGVSPLTGTIFAGKLDKSGKGWLDKKDVTEEAVRSVFEKMMMESERDNNKIREYSYNGFGKIQYIPEDKTK